MHCFPFLCQLKFCSGYFKQFFFHLGDKKSGRWSSVTIVQNLAWVDSALVVLDQWLSYRNGRVSKSDCIFQDLVLFLDISSVISIFMNSSMIYRKAITFNLKPVIPNLENSVSYSRVMSISGNKKVTGKQNYIKTH